MTTAARDEPGRPCRVGHRPHVRSSSSTGERGGAHAGPICDADAPTHYLDYWRRERPVDRGTLEVGDIDVFDPARLDFADPEYGHDLPKGKGRLRVRSHGYAATIVNGEIVTAEGEHTGARPEQVIREFERAQRDERR